MRGRRCFFDDMNAKHYKPFVTLLTVFCTHTLSAVEIQWIQPEGASAPARVIASEIDGLSHPGSTFAKGWKSYLKVYVVTDAFLSNEKPPPVLGSCELSGAAITFTPRFPFSNRVTYRAEFQLPESHTESDNLYERKIHSTWIPGQEKKAPNTEITQVYPTADYLPENLLKFYLTFSNPMSGGYVYDHIHLYNELDQEVELPFLELEEELWDDAMMRLTLFIDPGRIKRGVKPLGEIGPSLVNGERFRLVIDEDWKDASGIALKRAMEKSFHVIQPDRQAIDPIKWKIIAPKPDTCDALVIKFGESLDFALAQRLIEIFSSEGDWINGSKRLESNETELHFKPDSHWKKGDYTARVQMILEDLAGNNIGKSFEVDVFDDVQRRVYSKSTDRNFSVR